MNTLPISSIVSSQPTFPKYIIASAAIFFLFHQKSHAQTLTEKQQYFTKQLYLDFHETFDRQKTNPDSTSAWITSIQYGTLEQLYTLWSATEDLFFSEDDAQVLYDSLIIDPDLGPLISPYPFEEFTKLLSGYSWRDIVYDNNIIDVDTAVDNLSTQFTIYRSLEDKEDSDVDRYVTFTLADGPEWKYIVHKNIEDPWFLHFITTRDYYTNGNVFRETYFMERPKNFWDTEYQTKWYDVEEFYESWARKYERKDNFEDGILIWRSEESYKDDGNTYLWTQETSMKDEKPYIGVRIGYGEKPFIRETTTRGITDTTLYFDGNEVEKFDGEPWYLDYVKQIIWWDIEKYKAYIENYGWLRDTPFFDEFWEYGVELLWLYDKAQTIMDTYASRGIHFSLVFDKLVVSEKEIHGNQLHNPPSIEKILDIFQQELLYRSPELIHHSTTQEIRIVDFTKWVAWVSFIYKNMIAIDFDIIDGQVELFTSRPHEWIHGWDASLRGNVSQALHRAKTTHGDSYERYYQENSGCDFSSDIAELDSISSHPSYYSLCWWLYEEFAETWWFLLQSPAYYQKTMQQAENEAANGNDTLRKKVDMMKAYLFFASQGKMGRNYWNDLSADSINHISYRDSKPKELLEDQWFADESIEFARIAMFMNSLRVYPNPVTDKLHMRMRYIDRREENISITATSAITWQTIPLTASIDDTAWYGEEVVFTSNVSWLPAWVIIITIQWPTQRITTKIIKQ